MKMIKIDGKEYDFDSLSSEVKAQLQSLQFVDAELNRLAMQSAVLQTARLGYSKALNDALKTPINTMAQQLIGDTIKLG
jgi:hypothetical protein